MTRHGIDPGFAISSGIQDIITSYWGDDLLKRFSLGTLPVVLLLLIAVSACAQAEITCTATAKDRNCEAREAIPPLDSQITMFYYEDFATAIDYYGTTLGLTLEFDWPWIRFYKTSPSSSVGIVAEGEGAWHDAQETNAVMLSLVTSDVDAWYERLQHRDNIVFLKDIGDGGGIRSFLLEDPGGYTVEFFQWLTPEE